MKKTVSAAQAKELLDQEFARLQPSCRSCKTPTPFWGPGVLAGTGYWYLKVLPPCPNDCARVVSQIWARITTEYQIERTEDESGVTRYRGAVGKAGVGPARRQFRKENVETS